MFCDFVRPTKSVFFFKFLIYLNVSLRLDKISRYSFTISLFFNNKRLSLYCEAYLFGKFNYSATYEINVASPNFLLNKYNY